MDALIKMLDTALAFVTTIFTWIVANPLMLFLVACSLIPVGFKIFKSAKRAAAK